MDFPMEMDGNGWKFWFFQPKSFTNNSPTGVCWWFGLSKLTLKKRCISSPCRFLSKSDQVEAAMAFFLFAMDTDGDTVPKISYPLVN